MQELQGLQERLDRLETTKLIDVVKNSQQYGYSEDVRLYALSLLSARGVSQEDLELTGNFTNANYQDAERVYNSFLVNSKIAFFAYLILIIVKLGSTADVFSSDLTGTGFLIINIATLVVYLFCLLKSFMAQSEFYKIAGEDYAFGAFIYFLLGMPFYVIMYFIFKAQMKEKLKTVF